MAFPRGFAPRSLLAIVVRACAFVTVVSVLAPGSAAADTWIEIKAPNVTVLANGGPREARRLAWQLEQVRAAIVHIVPWARVDLDRPFLVFAVNSENRMRALVPQFFERSGDAKPVSVWVTGADRHYLAIRSDVREEDKRDINPHFNAYFSYISLVMSQSLERPLPLWLTRGFAGVLSNTVVRDTELRVGAPIPWHLRALRDGVRLRVSELAAMNSESLRDAGDLARFDAHAWAFVHFLMFGDNAARAPQMNQFFAHINNGIAADAAMAQSFGPIAQLEGAYVRYINQDIYTFGRLPADASVKRDGFPERTLPAHEAAAALGLFYVAISRPVEARAAIQEARKGGMPAPDSYLAEALLAAGEDQGAARAALARAVADSTTNWYAYFELARLQWQSNADKAALADRERLLFRAIELNPRSAWALAMLADVRSQLGVADAMAYVVRAIELAPSEPAHRLMGAQILWRAGMHAEALKVIDVALTLATTDEQRARARQMQQAIEREKPRAQAA